MSNTETLYVGIDMIVENPALIPTYASEGASGMDLKAKEPRTFQPGEAGLVPTGIRVAIPDGYEMQIRPRSGLALKHSVTVLNSPGTIDSDYRGEIGIILINHGKSAFEVTEGMRIAQAVITKVEKAVIVERDELPDTLRGEGGFGHTGMK